MKFQAVVETIKILDSDDEVVGFIDTKPSYVLFVPKISEFDVGELEEIIHKMKELQNGSST